MSIDIGLGRRLSRRWPRQRHCEMQICTCEAPLRRSSHCEGDTLVRQGKNFTLREIHGGKGARGLEISLRFHNRGVRRQIFAARATARSASAGRLPND